MELENLVSKISIFKVFSTWKKINLTDSFDRAEELDYHHMIANRDVEKLAVIGIARRRHHHQLSSASAGVLVYITT